MEATIEHTSVSAYDSVRLSQDKVDLNLKTVQASSIQSRFGGFDNLELQHHQLDAKLVTGSDMPSAKKECSAEEAPAPLRQVLNTPATTPDIVPKNSEAHVHEGQIQDQQNQLPGSFVPPLFHGELSMFSSRHSPISKHLTSSPEFDFTTKLN